MFVPFNLSDILVNQVQREQVEREVVEQGEEDPEEGPQTLPVFSLPDKFRVVLSLL